MRMEPQAPASSACPALLLMGLVWCVAVSPARGLEITFDGTGLSAISADGTPLLADGTPQVTRAIFQKEDGSKQTVKADVVEATFNADTKTLSRTYPWGSISCTYRHGAGRLAMAIEVRNTSADPLHQLHLDVLELQLAPDAALDSARHNVGAPTVIGAVWPAGSLALCNEQIDRPLTLSLAGGKAGRVAVRLRSGGDRMVYDELYLERPIAPGGADSYEISLRFGDADENPLDLGQDVFEAFRRAHPPQLDWPDRRPVTRLFFGGGLPKEQILAYYQDPESVELPQADEDFRGKMIERIDRAIAAAKELDAQGTIIWDIEGNSFPHPTTYIGDPRLTKILNPKMDDVADELFRRMSEAGLLSGVCIRPTQIVYDEEKETLAHRYGPVLSKYPDAPAFRQLDDKITYCKKRWGTRIFYVDTNFMWRPRRPDDEWRSGMIQADVWRRLIDKHPDILIIPEFHYLECMASVVPYHEYDMGFRGTTEFERRVYPRAWSVGVLEDEDPYEIYDLAVRNVRDGDALMTFAYGMTRYARAMKRHYDEAALRRLGEPDPVQNASPADLIAMLDDENLRTRFYAAARLGEQAEQHASRKAEALLEVATDEDADWLVRKNAIVSLGKLGTTRAIDPLVRLLDVSQPDLRYFAAEALGRIGSPAADAVLDELQSSDKAGPFVIDALGHIGDRRAVPALQRLLDPDAKSGSTREVLEALGRIGSPDAITALTEVLNDGERGVYVRCAAAEALGQTGRPAARQALEKARAEARKDEELHHLVWTINRTLNRMR